MYERFRLRVEESTKIPSQPPPSRPEQTSLAGAGRKAGPDEAEEQGLPMEGVYIISVAARLLEMHPQTLRKYERLGLINPGRTLGMLRLYSREDIRKVRLIRHLGDMGLNLAGVEFALATVENLLRLELRLLALTEAGPLRTAIEQEIGRIFRSLDLPVDD